jgi:seipin
MDSSPNQLSKY